MKKLLAFLVLGAHVAWLDLKHLYATEPARVIGYAAAAIVYVAAANGVVLPEVSVAHDLELVASIVATVEGIRTQVSPAR